MPTENSRADALTDAAITACALMIKGICLTKPSDEWAAHIEKRIRFMLSTAGTPTLTQGQPEPRAEVTGWKLAMRVLQSDLYPQLDDAERAECDALARANPYAARTGASS